MSSIIPDHPTSWTFVVDHNCVSHWIPWISSWVECYGQEWYPIHIGGTADVGAGYWSQGRLLHLPMLRWMIFFSSGFSFYQPLASKTNFSENWLDTHDRSQHEVGLEPFALTRSTIPALSRRASIRKHLPDRSDRTSSPTVTVWRLLSRMVNTVSFMLLLYQVFQGKSRTKVRS